MFKSRADAVNLRENCFAVLQKCIFSFILFHTSLLSENEIVIVYKLGCLFFLARFNHRFDEVQACRQEIVQILDQKLAKQGLSAVRKA